MYNMSADVDFAVGKKWVLYTSDIYNKTFSIKWFFHLIKVIGYQHPIQTSIHFKIKKNVYSEKKK